MATAQDLPSSEHHGAIAPPSLLQILWNRKPLIILGTVVGLIIGCVYFAQRKPVYESSAQVLVIKKTPNVPGLGMEAYGMFDDYLATHVILVGSPVVIENAVTVGKLNKLKSFEGQENPGPSIRGALKISRESAQGGGYSGGPSILNLSFRAGDPDDCAKVLDAVIEGYRQFLEEDYQRNSKETTKQLEDYLTRLKPDLEKAQKAEAKLHAGAPLSIGKDGVTAHEERLMSLRSRLSVLVLRRAELEGKLEAVSLAIKAGRDPMRHIDSVARDPMKPGGTESSPTILTDAQIETQMMPKLIELQNKQQLYGRDHPDVRMLKDSIDFTREILRSARATARPMAPSPSILATQSILDSGVSSVGLLASPGGHGPLFATASLANRSSTHEVILFVQDVEAQLDDLKATESKLNKLAKQEEIEVRSHADFRKEDEQLRERITDLKAATRAITTRLNEKTAGADQGRFEARVIAKPGSGYQVEPKAMPIFTVAILLGMAVGVALAWLAEATDRSFRTPDEVRRRLGLPVVGHVPRILPEADAVRQHEAGAIPLEPSICAFYQSKSVEAEAFRGIRTTLYFSTQNEDAKIIQVTSPNMGDGKTTLATNLAVSIAQSGKKILLIDADFRRPRLHRMFGVSARTGLVSVIQEKAELLDAIQPTVVENLSLLPCGPRPNNPAELLTSPRFKEILELLRERYDIILVDTPPLLAVSDPSVVATQVDGVLLTIRVSKNGRPAAERARDILGTLEANIIGVVVNGISKGGQEGYGASHYGYQYQYQYAYEPTDNRSYYQDGDPDSQVHKNGSVPSASLSVDPDAKATLAPEDPDAVDIGGTPLKPRSPAPPRVRNPRRAKPKDGLASGVARWLREALWP